MAKEPKISNLNKIAELQALAQLAGKQDSPKVQRWLKHVLYSNNPKIESNVRNSLIRMAQENIIHPKIFSVPSPELINGQIKLGVAENNIPFGLFEEFIFKHGFVAGETGSGKTSLLYHIAAYFIRKGWAVWFISPSKREWRSLLSIFPDILLFQVGGTSLKTNPPKTPEYVLQRQWNGAISSMFCEHTALMTGSEVFFTLRLNELWNLYSDINSVAAPSFSDISEYLGEYGDSLRSFSPDFAYCQRLKSRIDGAINCTDNMLDCQNGLNPEDVQEKNCIWEFDLLQSPVYQNFFIELIITRIFLQRVVSPEKRTPLILICDEVEKLFDIRRWNRNAVLAPNIGNMLDKFRAMGIAFFGSTHAPSKTMPNFSTSCGTKIALHLGSADDVYVFARSSGMTLEQINAMAQLPERHAVVKTPNCPAPFLIRIADITVPKTEITDKEIEEIMKPVYESIKVEPRLPYSEITRNKVSEEEEKFLLHITNNRLSPIVVRYAAINVPVDRGNRMKKRLLRMGFLREITLALGKKGGVVKLLSLTGIGQDYLKQKGFNISHEGKGGIEHYFYQSKVKSFFERKGHSAEIEGSVNGHCVDVLVKSPDGNLLAVEVAATTRDWESVNLQKDLDAGFSKIVFACKNKEVQETLMRKFAPNGKLNPRVELTLVKDYL